jgi:hypothetical protein
MVGIDIFWDNKDSRLVRWQMHDKWDMADVQQTNATALEMFAERHPEPIYVIVDLSDSKSVPRNFISGVSSVSRDSPPNWVMTVIVGSDALIRKLFEIGFRLDALLSEKYALAHSIEEARVIIADHRSQHSQADTS